MSIKWCRVCLPLQTYIYIFRKEKKKKKSAVLFRGCWLRLHLRAALHNQSINLNFLNALSQTYLSLEKRDTTKNPML